MIRIITSLVAVLTVTSIQSQTTLRDTPKLVIGITIDQLRDDYLQLFQHTFTEKGFKRLLSEGLVYSNMSFDFPNINGASAITTIYTGTNPFYHGIIDKSKFSTDKNTEVSVFEDDSYLGNYTKEKLSPLPLRVSTVADELKIASQGRSDVYSLAPYAFQALSSAGKLANGAYWLEDFTGKWATTTYFKDFDWSIDQQNRSNIYSNRPNELVWQPLLGSDKYNNFPYVGETNIFSHQWKQQSSNLHGQLKETPFVNENITQTALALLQKSALGQQSYPGFLAITYYAGNYTNANSSDYSLEIQDNYARLDRELSKLIEQVEKTVGLNNTLFFITSTGYYDSNYALSDNNKPANIFYTNRCEALLNMYLMAIYGKEQWVDRYYNHQIYLNRKLIESKNIDLKEIQDKAAEFVIQFTGVQDAITSTQLLKGDINPNMSAYRNSFNRESAGDIIIEIQSGYQIVDEKSTTKSQQKIQRESAVIAPVIFFGYNIKPEKIKRTIKATEIAPTVARILRIRSPNAAKEQPLPEFF